MPVQPVPATRQLGDLTAEKAADLINKLKLAQRQIVEGEQVLFELSAGSMASSDMAKVTARDAFLLVPFDAVWSIERVRSSEGPLERYKLAYAPKGLGEQYWEIEVHLNFHDELDQVRLIYKAPAPF